MARSYVNRDGEVTEQVKVRGAVYQALEKVATEKKWEVRSFFSQIISDYAAGKLPTKEYNIAINVTMPKICHQILKLLAKAGDRTAAAEVEKLVEKYVASLLVHDEHLESTVQPAA